MELKEGDVAPDFRAPTQDDEPFRLQDHRGKKVVLYFYPRDNTPGCTREACDFRDNIARLTKKKVVVVGVSPDSPKSHQGFRQKHELPFTLLSDADRKVAELYGVWQEKVLYGKKSFGIVRSTFLIDEEGRIQKVFRKVKVDGHVEQILALL